MKKPFNLRIPVLLAVAIAAGIATGYLFVFYAIDGSLLLIVLPAAAFITLIAVIVSKRVLPVVAVLLASALFALGAVGCMLGMNDFKDSDIIDGAEYTVTATVSDKLEYSDLTYIILDDLVLDGKKTDGKCKVLLYDGYGQFCDIGYKVTFTDSLYKNALFPYGKLYSGAEDGIKYSAYVSSGLISAYRFSFFGSIRARIRNTLYDSIDGDTAAVVFAMLTGNTRGMDDNELESFRYGGIAHIFAVSGLHIGIIYAVVTLILKKAGLNKYLSAVLCLGLIFFYVGICGFTHSSLRAAVMCTVNTVAGLIFRKYDPLNALSVSASAIMLMMPLNLFSVGFRLSVSAVAGIFLLSRSFDRITGKLPPKLRSALGTPIAAQAGTLPVSLASFGYLSGCGLLLNIAVLPLLSALFAVMFVSTAVCAVLPFIGAYVLPYAVLPFQALTSFLIGAGFERALISGFGAGAFVVLYYIALFTLSDKFNMTLFKRLTAFVCAAVMLVSYTLYRIYEPMNGVRIIVSAYYGGGQIMVKADGENILIVTDGLYTGRLFNFISNNYCTDITAVIVLGEDDSIKYFMETGVNTCDLYLYYADIPVQPFEDTAVHYEKTFEIGGVTFTFYDRSSILLTYGETTAGISCAEDVPFTGCDLLLSQYLCDSAECGYKVYFGLVGYRYNICDCGDISFTDDGGGITQTGVIPERAYLP